MHVQILSCRMKLTCLWLCVTLNCKLPRMATKFGEDAFTVADQTNKNQLYKEVQEV